MAYHSNSGYSHKPWRAEGGRGFGRGRGGRVGSDGYKPHADSGQATIRLIYSFAKAKDLALGMEAWIAQLEPMAELQTDQNVDEKGAQTLDPTQPKDSKEIVRIVSDGNIRILGDGPRTYAVFCATNAVLSVVGYYLRFSQNVQTGTWTVHKKDSTWEEVLEAHSGADIQTSAFPRRDWPAIKSQLIALPTEIPIGKKPRMHDAQRGNGSGFNVGSGLPAADPTQMMMMMMMMSAAMQGHAQATGSIPPAAAGSVPFAAPASQAPDHRNGSIESRLGIRADSDHPSSQMRSANRDYRNHHGGRGRGGRGH